MGLDIALPPVSTDAEPGTIMVRDDQAGFRGSFQAWGPTDPAIAIGALEHDLLIASSTEVLTPSAASEVTGFACAGGHELKRMLWLLNYSAFSVTLKHADAGSSATNRIYTPSGADYVIGPMSQAFLTYWDGGWRLFA